jgi:hypothetical protein
VELDRDGGRAARGDDDRRRDLIAASRGGARA